MKQPFTRHFYNDGDLCVVQVEGQTIAYLHRMPDPGSQKPQWINAEIKIPNTGSAWPHSSALKAAQHSYKIWRGRKAEVQCQSLMTTASRSA